jgi:L-ascorbate metabolism protein UlaG (beta-lactamase superfamily)
MNAPRIVYIGGPTAVIEWAGWRFLTDPAFDPAGTSYTTPVYTLRKTMGPAIAADAIGPIDAVLLSHDHHFDNLDHAGRTLVDCSGRVITTTAGAVRLGGNAIGLTPWETVDLVGEGHHHVRVTATPARHGPAGVDRGPVVGFVLRCPDDPGDGVYISGDTVWFDGVQEVAARCALRTAILFMGAARVTAVGHAHLTFTAAEGVLVAQAMPTATIVPLHYEGWEHFSESRAQIEQAFASAGLTSRVHWLEAGVPTDIHRIM